MCAKDTIYREKHKVLELHNQCDQMNRTVTSSDKFKNVEEIKNNLIELIKSPEFMHCTKKDEFQGNLKIREKQRRNLSKKCGISSTAPEDYQPFRPSYNAINYGT